MFGSKAILFLRKSYAPPRVALCALLVSCCIPQAVAQNVAGAISGVVKDSAGALVAGASVTIANSEQHRNLRTYQTDGAGRYSFTALPVGTYALTVADTGFSDTQLSGIKLNANDTLTFDLVLKPGTAAQTVNVQASPLEINLGSAQLAGLIDGTQIRQLSLNNRNYEQLIALQPGVVYGGGDQLYIGLSNPSGETNVVSFSIDGQRNSGNNWTLDGADNVDRGTNLTLLTYPSVDAIAEFKTLRGTYSAEYGRSASGQINVITRSGTSGLHGSAYEFFRNDVLNANSYLNNLGHQKRPALRYNDFGYTVGGPVFIPHVYNTERNKTFFFFSQEFRRVITYVAPSGIDVATAAERQGNFGPAIVCTSYNTATGACLTKGSQVTVIDPTAQAYLKDLYANVPLPNSPIDPHGLIYTARNVYNATQELVRIDHYFSSKFSVYGHFINDSIPTIEPAGLFSSAVAGGPLPGVQTTSTNSPGRNILVHGTYVFSPTFLLDAGYAYSRGAIVSTPIGGIAKANSPDIKPVLPFTSTLSRVPSVVITGGSGFSSFGPYADYNREHNPFINVTKVLGGHSLKFGATYFHYQKTENAGGDNAGAFTFGGGTTPAGVTGTAFQQSFAAFLAGYAVSFNQSSVDLTPDIQTNQFEVYAQDDWKVTPRLTLNAGLRYSFFQQPIDATNRLSNFDPRTYSASQAPAITTSGNLCTTAPCTGSATPNPAYNPLNGVILGGKNSPFGSHVGEQAKLDFAPRIGFAYDVSGNGRTALRGGYGIAYDATLFGIYEQNIFGNIPYVQDPTIINASFGNPAAGTPRLSLVPPSLRASPYLPKDPYVQQYSLDLQQQLSPGWIFDIGYVGATGIHLLGIVDVNQPLPGAYVTAGLAASGGITRANTQTLNRIRPYLGYGPINQVQPRFTSNYNSLQSNMRRQFKDGSLLDLNYTWSKALTNNQSDRSNAPQNSYDIAGEYGLSQLDRRNVFTGDFVYFLPFFRTQRGIVGHTLGGWEISGVVAANSGLPLTVTTSADPAGQGTLNSASLSGARPDQIGNPNSGAPRTIAKWFNTSAFAAVPTGQARPGTERRGTVTGPGFQRWDLSIFKDFKIVEGAVLQFRAESFNTFNHTNFDAVSTSTTSSSYGQITNYRDPRLMQLALKLTF